MSAELELSKATSTVVEKLKRHPEFKNESIGALILQARTLSNPQFIRDQFSYLLDSINNIVIRTGTENDEPDQLTTSFDSKAARRKDQQNLANAMNIPVKLVLQKLRHRRPPLANKLSQLIGLEYGPLHSRLQVGEITIEWGNEGLVIPTMVPYLPGEFEMQVPKENQWYDQAKELTKALGDAEKRQDQEEKFDIVFTSMAEKFQLIDRLVDVIVRYNCEKSYNVFKCNCQHFTRDALVALGYKDPIKFTGKMGSYFEQLKRGKLTVPKEYSTHEALDEYVENNLQHLTLPDMEYLLCQYFKYHLPHLEEVADGYLDDWNCTIKTCQSETLDSMVRERSSFGHQLNFEKIQVQQDDTPTADLGEIMEDIPEELQEVTLEQQKVMLRKIKGGYRGRMLYKLQKHPDYQELIKDELIVDKLTEKEVFRNSYCMNIIEGVSEKLVADTLADSQASASVTGNRKAMIEKARRRMNILCNLPVKLVLFKASRKSTQLRVGLQVGVYYFEWDKSSLVIPQLMSELTAKKPVLKVGVPQIGMWTDHVNSLQSQMEQALESLDYDAIIRLQYHLIQQKDELLDTFINTVVTYNRTHAYNRWMQNSVHFVKNAQSALGILEPAKISLSPQEHLKKTRHEWTKEIEERSKLKIASHDELDVYVEGTFTCEEEHPSQVALDYCMAHYFLFHVAGWEKDHNLMWTCKAENCKLSRVEELVELIMW